MLFNIRILLNIWILYIFIDIPICTAIRVLINNLNIIFIDIRIFVAIRILINNLNIIFIDTPLLAAIRVLINVWILYSSINSLLFPIFD